jgi:CheY-like chemotaxis protein
MSVASTAVGTVLCVEDDRVNYLLVAAALEMHLPAVTLLRAATAAEAVRVARERRPSLMLLDLRLPDRPGLEVVRELDREICAGALSVVVVTADRMGADLVKARALGVRDIVFKPIDIERFVGLVARELLRSPAVAATAPTGAPHSEH